ncbi:MAG TPA: phosphoglucomutase/phosphomannomutase family protein, partial [Erysipelothrix sp.]
KKVPKFHLEIDHISYMDGLKVYFKDGAWISARFSGTEPLIRVFAEANTDADLHRLTQDFEKQLSL